MKAKGKDTIVHGSNDDSSNAIYHQELLLFDFVILFLVFLLSQVFKFRAHQRDAEPQLRN